MDQICVVSREVDLQSDLDFVWTTGSYCSRNAFLNTVLEQFLAIEIIIQ